MLLPQLPDLPGDAIVLHYDYVPDRHGEPRWHVFHGDRVVWFDWAERPDYGPREFEATVATLRRRYRARLRAVELGPEARRDLKP